MIRIFHPALDDVLVREVVDVLQIMKPDHQPCRRRRTTRRLEDFPKALIESRPRYQPRQTNQTMPHIDDRIEPFAEQTGMAAPTANRLHQKTPEFEAEGSTSRHYLTRDLTKESLQISVLMVLSERTP